MAKRERLEILRDTLKIIQENKNFIKPTILLRKSKMSSIRFKEYHNELISHGFIKENIRDGGEKAISLTEKGFNFLERYKSIMDFIQEFEL